MVIVKWENGDKYDGEWIDNKKQGHGVLYYKNGGKYVGDWVNDLRHGYGVNVWSNGSKYMGTWKENRRHGYGIFVYPDKGKYVGEWIDDMRDGYGENTWANGDRYEGNWKKNRRDGKGKFIHIDGEIEEGEWHDNDKGVTSALTSRRNNVIVPDAKDTIKFNLCWLNGQPAVVILRQKTSTCPFLALAREYVTSLKWDENFFEPTFDRCYCDNCYKKTWDSVIKAGDGKYVIPRGWVRLGLRTDPCLTKNSDIWNKWIVTYHGTTEIAALSIVTHRQFCWPGDTLIDGTKLNIRTGHIPGQNYVFTSPTIAYASSLAYSPVFTFHSNDNESDFEVQIVLQCRQMPKSYKIGPETIGAGSERICPHIRNSKIEYYTERRGSIVAYGLLARFRQKNT